MDESENSKKIKVNTWYAIQTLHCKEERVGEFFEKSPVASQLPGEQT